MTTARLISRLALLGLLAATPLRLDAQAAGIDAICRNTAQFDISTLGLAAGDPLLKLFPDSARAHLGSLVTNEQWTAASDSLESWFRSSDAYELRPANAAVLLAQLDTIARLLARADTGMVSSADILVAPGSTHDFNPQLTLGVGYQIFPSTPSEITLTPDDPAAVQAAFCWTALSASDLLGRYRRPAFEALRQRIRTALSLWNAYNETGRSQYPWELWMNGLGGNALKLEPPRRQIILLHPWIGVEAVGLDRARFDDLGPITRVAVVPFDLVGLIRYNDTYTRYYGASLMLSFGADRTRGGIAVHLSNGVSFGPTWARVGAPDGVLFSIDFYQLLAGLPYVQQMVSEKLGAAANTSLSPSD